MLLGYNTWSMPGMDVIDALDTIASAGFDSAEISIAEGWPTSIDRLGPGETAVLRRRLASGPPLLTGFTANVPLDGSEEVWPARRSRLLRCLDLAARFSRPERPIYVSTTTGADPSADQAARLRRDRDVLVDRLGLLAEAAAERGVVLHLEPHVHTAVHTPEAAVAIMRTVDHPGLRLTLDISHFLVQGFDVAETVVALAPWTGAVEVKDQRGRRPDFTFLVPGEGTQDYALFLRVLAAAGYRGSVSVEIAKMRQARPGYDAAAAVRESHAVLARAFAAAGITRTGVHDGRVG